MLEWSKKAMVSVARLLAFGRFFISFLVRQLDACRRRLSISRAEELEGCCE